MLILAVIRILTAVVFLSLKWSFLYTSAESDDNELLYTQTGQETSFIFVVNLELSLA